MNRTLKSVLQFLFFLSLGVAIITWIYVKLEGAYMEECLSSGRPDCSFSGKIASDFRQVNLWWILLIMALFMISNWSRASRWLMLTEALGYQASRFNAFFTVMLGYFANMGLPRMGEFVRAGSFARYERLPVDRVMGTIVTDRLFDVMALGIFILLALLLEFELFGGYLAEHAVLPGFAWLNGPWLLAILGVIGVIILRKYRWFISLLPGGLKHRVQNIADGVKEGILSVKKLHRPGLFIFHSAFIWILYFAMTWLCFYSFPATAHLGMKEGLIVFVFGSLGMVIPTPGGLGSYHYLVMVALGLYGINDSDSFSFAFILYLSIAILCNVVFGILALILLPLYNRRYKQNVELGQTVGDRK